MLPLFSVYLNSAAQLLGLFVISRVILFVWMFFRMQNSNASWKASIETVASSSGRAAARLSSTSEYIYSFENVHWFAWSIKQNKNLRSPSFLNSTVQAHSYIIRSPTDLSSRRRYQELYAITWNVVRAFSNWIILYKHFCLFSTVVTLIRKYTMRMAIKCVEIKKYEWKY